MGQLLYSSTAAALSQARRLTRGKECDKLYCDHCVPAECCSALHYVELRNLHTGELLFTFDHCELRLPFSPERFLAVTRGRVRPHGHGRRRQQHQQRVFP
jgi:hypothetical protein